jgi:eukaryotic-like serine/threonine-protein kinase
MDEGGQSQKLPMTLGPYRMLRLLGSGGLSQVFLARKVGASGFEKDVALKTLLPELEGQGVFERLLIEEALMGSRFSHRNLVHVHDLGLDRGTYYVCMDFVDGASLSRLTGMTTKDKPVVLPALELSLFIAVEICLALEYVHRLTDAQNRPMGLVHRDVSPSNILISRDGEVKLADFGIAKATLLSDTTWGRLMKGTVAYMSPEQLHGESLTSKSDQFSFGVMLAEILSGSRPFDGSTLIETMDRTKHAEDPDLSHVPSALRPLIRRCLAREPNQRYQGFNMLRRELEQLRSHLPMLSTDELRNWVAIQLGVKTQA